MNCFLTKYIDIAEHLNFFIFLLVVCTLPFPWHFTQPLIVAWGISWLLEGRWLQWRNFRLNKTQVPILLICILIGWEATSLLWVEDTANGIREWTKHLPILAVAVVSLFGVNKYYKIEKVQIALYAATLISVISYLLLQYWAKFNDMVVIYGQYVLWDTWNMFNIPPMSNIKHHSYYCPILLMALGCTKGLYHHFCKTYPRWSVLLTLGIGDMILIATIILSGSRTTFLLMPLLLLLLLWQYRRHRYARKIGTVILLLTALLGSLIWTQSSVTQKFKQSFQRISYEDSKDQPFSREPRIYIWHIILHDVSDYGWKGMGIGSSDAYLAKAYEQDGIPEVIDRSFGTHNQYLQTWMELGPIAMIFLFLIVLIVPFFHSRKVRWASLYLNLIYGMSMLTECYFSRMSGVFQLCFAAVLLLALEQEQEQEASMLSAVQDEDDKTPRIKEHNHA